MATLYVIPIGLNTAFFDSTFPSDTSFKSAVPSAELTMQPSIGSVLTFVHQRDGVTGSSATPVAGANWDEILDQNGDPWGGSLLDVVDKISRGQQEAAAGGGGGGGGSDNASGESIFYDSNAFSFVRKISKYDFDTGVTTDVYKDFITDVEYTPIKGFLFDVTYYQKASSETLTALANGLNIGMLKSTTQNIRSVGTHTIAFGATGATRVKIVALAASTFSFQGVTYPLTTASGGSIVDIDISAGVGRGLADITYTVLSGTVLEIAEY